jgi:Leucine-rich repeat (LRR) protein
MKFEYTEFVPSKFGPQPPPLKRLEFYSRKETVISFTEFSRLDAHNVLLININNSPYPISNIASQLSRFVNCQFLALRNCGITTVKGVKLPHLRVCILSDNQITHHSDVIGMLSHSPLLQHLVLRGNRLESNSEWKDNVLCNTLRLISLNDFPVTITEKQFAVERYGTIQQKNQFSYMKWDWTINFLCDRMRLLEWKSDKFTYLNLKQANLKEFHVGVFPNLKKLNLSNNQIISLQRSGLERCSKLVELDFSYNQISSEQSLDVLKYCPKLRNVTANDNPLPDDYELYIVFHTSSLRGTNRCPGLQQLNGKDVALQLRTRAVMKYGTQEQIQKLQWYYALINNYGHFQLRKIPDFVSRVRIMEITGQPGLTIADLSPFTCLQFCNLSRNNLQQIIGISRLKYVRYFNVAKNPKLDHEEVIKSLSKLTNLRHVLLGEAVLTSPRPRRPSIMSPSASSDNHSSLSSSDSSPVTQRRVRLMRFLLKNSKMFALDGKHITLKERIEACPYTRMSQLELMRYKFYLAIVYQVVPFNDRVFTDKAVMPSSGLYDPRNIKILHLSNLNLRHACLDFEPFVCLEKLDLSNNMIGNILNIKLQYCRRLEILDVADNQIKNSVTEVAELLNNFKSLEIVVFRGNPIANSSSYRDQLLKSLHTMRATTAKLKILDTEVTPKDRQAVWEFHNLDTKEEERKRFRLTMKERGYLDVERDEDLKDINLNDCSLRQIQLSPYMNLEILLLRGNRLKTLQGTGILDMRQLKLVDLRNNKLSQVEEIIQLIRSNPLLESIGLKLANYKDNNFYRQNTNYRDLIIKNVPSLRNEYSRFWEIDEKEISIEEIENNWPDPPKLSSDEQSSSIAQEKEYAALFRFRCVIWRKYLTITKLTKPLQEIQVIPSKVLCLDLRDQKLKTVNFKAFINLKKLSLRNNLLSDQNFIESGLLSIKIEELDIQENQIKTLDVVSNFVDDCRSLRMFFFVNNPCSPLNRRKVVRKQFLSILNNTTNPKWTLILDGLEVSVTERCASVEKKINNTYVVETLRLELTLAEEGYTTGHENMIFLSHKKLSVTNKLEQFRKIAELDLSNNNIQELSIELFKSLKHLTKFDIRFNNLRDYEQCVTAIGHSGSLRVLYLEKAGPAFTDPSTYTSDIFKAMRVVSSIDDIRNPYPLGNDQRLAIQYLSGYDVSPNNLKHVVFDQQLGKRQFWTIVLALNALVVRYNESEPEIGPESLTFAQDTFKGFDFRFLMIHHIPTLEMIDSVAILDSELSNVKLRQKKLVEEIEEHRLLFASDKDKVVGLSDRLTFDNIRKSVMAQKTYILNTFGPTNTTSTNNNSNNNNSSSTNTNNSNRMSRIFKRQESKSNIAQKQQQAPPATIQKQSSKMNLSIQIPETTGQQQVQEEEHVVIELLEHKHGDDMVANEHLSTNIDNEVIPEIIMEPTKIENLVEEDIDFVYIENNFRTITLIHVYKQLLSQRDRQTLLSTIIGALDKLEIFVYFLQLFAIVYAFNIPWPKSFALVAKWISLANISLEVLFPGSIPSNEYVSNNM